MKSDINGCSTCPKGEERYERFIHRGLSYYQYEFRSKNGELFTCVKPTYDKCKEELNKWLMEDTKRISNNY